MKILVVGSGGREHAMVWRLRQSPEVEKIWCAPGNGGIEDVAECVPVDAADVGALVSLAERLKPDLTVVGTGSAAGRAGSATNSNAVTCASWVLRSGTRGSKAARFTRRSSWTGTRSPRPRSMAILIPRRKRFARWTRWIGRW